MLRMTNLSCYLGTLKFDTFLNTIKIMRNQKSRRKIVFQWTVTLLRHNGDHFDHFIVTWLLALFWKKEIVKYLIKSIVSIQQARRPRIKWELVPTRLINYLSTFYAVKLLIYKQEYVQHSAAKYVTIKRKKEEL